VVKAARPRLVLYNHPDPLAPKPERRAEQLALLLGQRTDRSFIDFYSVLLPNGHIIQARQWQFLELDVVSRVGALNDYDARPVFPLFGYLYWDSGRQVCRVRYCPAWDYSYLCDLPFSRLPSALARPAYAVARGNRSAEKVWVERVKKHYRSSDFQVVPIVVGRNSVEEFRTQTERLGLPLRTIRVPNSD